LAKKYDVGFVNMTS